MSPVTIETALAGSLRSLSVQSQITLDHTQISFDLFYMGIVEKFSYNSQYVENILILYIGSILGGLRNTQVPIVGGVRTTKKMTM